jgi:hypothetical protein
VTISKYVYYIVGAVSSGESTIIRHLRDLETIEEWPVTMPPIMNRPSFGLDAAEESQIDKDLEAAIWTKNAEIRDIKTGIVAVDRAPLDFIAFPVKDSDTLGHTAKKRTTAVLRRLEANRFQDLSPGQVIVVQSEPETLLERQLQRSGRTTPEQVADGSAEEYLRQQQERLVNIYEKAIDAGSTIKTNRCSLVAPVKAAARIIHFQEYKPFDFVARLEEIRSGK